MSYNNYTSDQISYNALKKDIRSYTPRIFFSDMWAGLIVSLISIPQALAYAIVVGAPPACGLVSIIFGTAICALLGSSRHLIVGPNNTTVLLVQAAIASILFTHYRHFSEQAQGEVALQIMAALLFFAGVFQILFGLFKLGRVIQFVSQAVVIGYIAGAACVLTFDQLYNFFGIHPSDEATSLFEQMVYFFVHLPELHPVTTAVGVLSVLILITFYKMKLKVPASLAMLIIVTFLVYFFDLHKIATQEGSPLIIIGDTWEGRALIPPIETPLFDLRIYNSILPFAFAIALFGMLETTSITKTVAASSGQRLHINQELFALGSSNFVLSFFGALPCSGSISRTLLNYESGAKTRFAAVLSCAIGALFVGFFGFLIQYVPLTALAALLVSTALRVIDLRQIKLCLRATHSDAFVLIITFLSCVFFNLYIAFYIGVVLSIVLYLRKAATPQVVEYSYNEETDELRPLSAGEKRLKSKMRIINIEGELFFGAVDLFQSTLKAIAEDDTDTKVFILRLKHVRDLDATAALALKQLYDYLRKSGRYLLVASIPPSVWNVLENARLVNYIGRENLFLLDAQNPYQAIEQALDRARKLIESDKVAPPQDMPIQPPRTMPQ